MAYKFQIGSYTASGSLEQKGALSCDTSLTVDTTTISAAEIGVLDSVTAGTAAASKALVLDANKDIGTIRNLTIDGVFTDGNYTFDTSGNVTGLGTMGVGAITTSGVLDITDATDASDASGDTGALRTEGGASIAKKLYVGTDLDVDGTTNLDAVDIDGNVQLDGTFTVGVDDTGQDVKFFGATSGQYMLWDESADELVLAGDSKLSFHDAAGGENIIASANGHLEVNAGTTLDCTAPTIDMNAATLFNVLTPSFIISGSAEDTPVLQIKNYSDDIGGPELRLVKDKGSAGAANDSCGKITFYGDDGNQDNINFAMIQVQVSDATNGQEGGKMSLQVANHDGGLGTGLLLEDGSADNEIDVEIGKGADCNITMAGSIVLPSTTTKARMVITDNLGEAFSIIENPASPTTYFEIKTTNNSEHIKLQGISGTEVYIGHSTSETYIGDNLTVEGDLRVRGSTITVDSTTIAITGSWVFEGATADAHETTFGVVDATADATINLPAMSAGTYYVPVLAAASTVAISSTPAELNLLDAITRGSILYGNASGASAKLAKGSANTVLSSDGTDISYTAVSNAMLAGSIVDSKLNQLTTAGKVALSALEIDGGTDIGAALVDADLFIVDDGAGGTNRKCAMSRLKTYLADNQLNVTAIENGDSFANGVNYVASGSAGTLSASLPNAPTVGDRIMIKAPISCNESHIIKVMSPNDETTTIDGVAHVHLSSPFAAITLVYAASGSWSVF